MLDLTFSDADKKDFITDLTQDENSINITYADNHTAKDTSNSIHNMNFYRGKMLEQYIEHGPYYELKLGEAVAFNQLKKLLSVIIDAAAIYFNVTLNPNILLKIIVTILLIAGEIAYMFWNKIGDVIYDEQARELLSLNYYYDNKSTFEYYSKEQEEFIHLVPIEQLTREKITKEDLIKIKEVIDEYKKQGISLDTIKVDFKSNRM